MGHAAAAGHGDHHEMQTVTGVDNRKWAMWTLLASECFLFGTMIINFLVKRDKVADGPTAQQVYDLNLTTISTFVLLMSSVAMVLALHYHREREVSKFRWWTFAIVVGGAIFLGFQAYEFHHFVVDKSMGLSTSVFASAFYLLTGCHGLHVTVGVLWMASILVHSFLAGANWFNPVMVEIAGLYWHFVDVIWIVIFTVVYLLVYI